MSDLSYVSRPVDAFTAGGAEAAKFLHSMLTQDITGMRPGDGRAAAKTDRMAKVEAPMLLFRHDEGLLGLSDPGCLAAVLPKLKMFVFGADCQLEDVSSATALVSLLGEIATETLTGLGASLPGELPWAHVATDVSGVSVRVVRSKAFRRPGFDLVVADGDLTQLLSHLEAAGASVLEADPARGLRVEAGRAVFGVDYVGDRMPTEVGLQDAVSYNKGCYVGQEILERLRSRGKVTRLLRGLILESGPDGLEVTKGEKALGLATSLSPRSSGGGWIALASLKEPDAEPGAILSVGGVDAVVTALPLEDS